MSGIAIVRLRLPAFVPVEKVLRCYFLFIFFVFGGVLASDHALAWKDQTSSKTRQV